VSSKNNVVNLRGESFTAKSFEELLERSKNGEIKSIAIAIECTDGTIVTDYAFENKANVFTLMGAVKHVGCRIYDENVQD